MEDEIMKRIEDIISEYAQLKHMENFDLSIELVNELGDVNVVIKKDKVTFERTIGHKEYLGWISDTFSYPDTFTPQSKDINAKDLLGVYFGDWGDLIVVKKDSTEIFRVKSSQREELTTILKAKYGVKFNKPPKIVPKTVKNTPKVPQEMMYKVFFTTEKGRDYFIIAGESLERIKATALDVINKRGLDVKANEIYSEKINN